MEAIEIKIENLLGINDHYFHVWKEILVTF